MDHNSNMTNVSLVDHKFIWMNKIWCLLPAYYCPLWQLGPVWFLEVAVDWYVSDKWHERVFCLFPSYTPWNWGCFCHWFPQSELTIATCPCSVWVVVRCVCVKALRLHWCKDLWCLKYVLVWVQNVFLSVRVSRDPERNAVLKKTNEAALCFSSVQVIFRFKKSAF